MNSDMPEQARKLVEAFKKHKIIRIDRGWKLITLLVGGNDLCQFCDDTVGKQLSTFTPLKSWKGFQLWLCCSFDHTK